MYLSTFNELWFYWGWCRWSLKGQNAVEGMRDKDKFLESLPHRTAISVFLLDASVSQCPILFIFQNFSPTVSKFSVLEQFLLSPYYIPKLINWHRIAHVPIKILSPNQRRARGTLTGNIVHSTDCEWGEVLFLYKLPSRICGYNPKGVYSFVRRNSQTCLLGSLGHYEEQTQYFVQLVSYIDVSWQKTKMWLLTQNEILKSWFLLMVWFIHSVKIPN